MADDLRRFLMQVRATPEVERIARQILQEYKALIKDRGSALPLRPGTKSERELAHIAAVKSKSVH